MSAYSFRPMTAGDLPMTRRWLETPEVRLWWGDPDEQAALLEGDLLEQRMAMWIVSHEGRPFAYVQDYDPLDWALRFDGLPPGARGLDPFIGEPDMLGRGHGSAFLRAHADGLLAAGAPAVFIDPDPENDRAVRAYAKAGFEAIGERLDLDGETVLLMVRTAEDALRNERLEKGAIRI